MSTDSTDVPTPYTPSVPRPAPDRAALRARIPGWGVDLDPADRPSGTVEVIDDEAAGRGMPTRQALDPRRERSIEHAFLTPVYGTAQPLHGLSGGIRRLAYDRFSEGRAAHWLLLILGDRVEAIGAHVRSLASLRPDNPITETGVLAETRRHPIRSRIGRGRVDLRHTWMDPLIVAGPWILAGWAVIGIARRALRRH
ncbi:hypothetical protein [Microbacterium sp. cf332]|uniref:hypothetical protein n=1 Tax=Microbacterium sp. cf332 TaxID=1761804 RepID=UPI00088F1C23|nr:hypothetical protein [Microbacterium sp. cf332]SDQ89583.1 hypothetical protein SAMN04487847_2909 [Microbacterium sp. cf332]